MCAAIGVFDGQTVLVNGITSHKKGMGTVALGGLLSQYDATAIAVCEKEVEPFYLKNDFKPEHNLLDDFSIIWRKNCKKSSL